MCGQYFKLSENWIHTQLANLDRHQPVVLTQRTNNLDDTSWCPPIHAVYERAQPLVLADRVGRRVFDVFPSYFWRAWRWKASILHAHFGVLGYQTLPIARTLGIPLVTTFYGFDLSLLPTQRPQWHDRYATLFEHGTLFLVEGGHMREQLVDLGCPPDKARVHHLGVDVDAYPFAPRTRAPGEPLRILMVGRFAEKKGMTYGLEAFARFVDAGGEGRLTLIGGVTNDRMEATEAALKRIVDANGLHDVVDFRGLQPLDALRAAYRTHHVLLAPSVQAANGDNEGGAPVSIIEAAATGMPVVGSRHCDIPEVVIDGETGCLVDERDVAGLADALATLAADPDRVRAMGRAGRQHVAENYNAAAQGRQLDALYASLLDAR